MAEDVQTPHFLSRAVVESALASLGYTASGENENIILKIEAINYQLIISNSDNYLRVTLPSFFEVKTAKDYTKLLETLLEITRETRVVKMFIYKEWVWASFEGYLTKQEEVRPFIRLGLNHVNAAAMNFFKLQPDAPKE